MNKDKLVNDWLNEEKSAKIHGWDFSHIEGKYEEENDLPWNYREIIFQYLTSQKKLLDIDTGGAEFLLSLNHPHKNTSATELYPPNVELCRNKLLPLGIDFKKANASRCLPYDDQSFDIVINRHGSFNAKEIYRVLKQNGIFITEQVGAENDRELVELLLGSDIPLPFPKQYRIFLKKQDLKLSDHKKHFALLNSGTLELLYGLHISFNGNFLISQLIPAWIIFSMHKKY